MSIKIASMNFGDCDTILHNTPNGMKNIAEVLGPNGEVYWSATKELTGVPPLSIRSNGTMLLDYLISGNMSQSGTPTHDSPIQPQECGERTKNLFDKDNADIADLYPDTTTREIKQSSNLSTWSIVLPVEPSTTYTFTMGEATTAIRRRVGMCSDYPAKGAYCTSVDDTPEYDHPNLGNIFTTDADTKYVLIMYVSGAGRDVAIERANRVQVVKGNTALPYEPYGYKLTISSANTTTPVYLGEVETTRRVKKLVLTGEENWLMNADGWFYLTSVADDYLRSEGNITSMCSHYPTYKQSSAIAQLPEGYTGFSWGSVQRLYLKDTSHRNDLSSFKQWVAAQYAAGTPVTVWYVLATPETVTLNEPIRKIGTYADTVSYEQAQVQIPTVSGTTIIDVETTLKPSQMYIKYK